MSSHIRKLIDSWTDRTKFQCPLQWEMLKTDYTPMMVYHTGIIIDDFLYLHGGSSSREQFDTPVSLFYRFDLLRFTWENLSHIPNTPALSNHACVCFDNRYLVIIGGWNGKSCESIVYLFDTKKQYWMLCETNGLPNEMQGFACHTANVINLPNALPQILIITSNSLVHKHHTLAFKLSTDSNFTNWTFSKLPNRAYFQIDHANISLEHNILFCVGGNHLKLKQRLHIYGVEQDPRNHLVTALISHAIDGKFNFFTTRNWTRESCRSPILVAGKFGFLFMNGLYYQKEGFRHGAYIYLMNGRKHGFRYVGDIIENMAFGVCVTDPKTGNTYYHGGLKERDTSQSRIYILKFFYEEIRRGLMFRKGRYTPKA